jgi:hypothetical protein
MPATISPQRSKRLKWKAGMIILFYLVPIAVAATIGIGIWRSGAAQMSEEEKRTLRFLGLNLVEPGINVLAVTGLMLLFQPDFISHLIKLELGSAPLWTYFGPALGLTLPMAVLLLPGLGWNSADWECRQINRQLVALALLRWGMSALTLIWLPGLLGGMTIFVGSILWVSRQADFIKRRRSDGVMPLVTGDHGSSREQPREPR